MISEAAGKILGMAMAYGVSALGLLLAYLNYRRRIVKAERAMSATAWAVVAITALAVILGAWTVARLAPPGAQSGTAGAELAAPVLSPPAAAPVERAGAGRARVVVARPAHPGGDLPLRDLGHRRSLPSLFGPPLAPFGPRPA